MAAAGVSRCCLHATGHRQGDLVARAGAGNVSVSVVARSYDTLPGGYFGGDWSVAAPFGRTVISEDRLAHHGYYFEADSDRAEYYVDYATHPFFGNATFLLPSLVTADATGAGGSQAALWQSRRTGRILGSQSAAVSSA